MALNAGTKLGPYEIIAPVGAGGMGEVYRARDTRLDRTVAIKVLNSSLASSPELKQRFEREGKAISSLQHPHICALFDVGSQDGTDFLVMEYLEGDTLADRLRKGALPLEQALKIGIEIADALDKAARAGIVHRDLKPGNIMLTKSGAKLMDFGLAKPAMAVATAGNVSPSTPTMSVRSLAAPASPLTQKGTIVGTFQYIAPEVLQGTEADARSDIFSFGCVLYEMITGRRAFEGQSQISVLAAILDKEPDPVSVAQPLTPPALDFAVRTCLAKNPEERYATAHDIELQLKWLSTAGVRPLELPRKTQSGFVRSLRIAVGAVALLAFAVAGYVAHRAEPVPALRAAIELPAGEQLEVVNASIALTADGRNLAVTTTDSAGNTRIWVRVLDSAKWRRMAGTDGASYPFWSPDGRNLAFFKDGKLKKLDVASGAVQTICDAPDARGGSWGTAGEILFAPEPFGALELVSSDGGTPVPVTDAPAKEGITHRMPHFLPDGRHALFVSARSSNLGDKANGIYLLDLKTKQARQVMSSGFEGQYVAPGYLVFVRDGNLVAQPFDRDSGQVSGSPKVIAEAVVLNSSRFTGAYALSQNGMLVTYTTPQQSQLTWFDMEGRKLGTLGPPAHFDVPPVISKDGRHVLAQIGDLSETTISPYWYDVARGIGTKLPIPEHQHSTLAPDDKTILYTAASGTLKTYALDGSTAPAIVLSGAKIPYVSAWNPDGRSAMYCIQQQGKMDLRFLTIASGESRSFGLVPGASCVGTFSPDGRWLAFQSEESGQNEVYVAPVGNANNRMQVSSGGGFLPVWLGNRIYYVNGQRKLMAVDLRPSANGLEIGVAKEMLGGQALGGQLIAQGSLGTGEYVTRDGKRVLLPISVTDTSPPLSVVTNWTEALKK